MAEPHQSDNHLEPIAIIGMACRFPGAPDVLAFWNMLCDGVDAVSQVPSNRWDADKLYDPDIAAPGKINSKWGGFIEGVDEFDSEFFGIAPLEADLMDPQQRLLLEVAWHALEDAALNPASLAGTMTGVFLGVANRDYARFLYENLDSVQGLTNIGASGGISSNRISYTLDLRGPSLVIDTACSSSLTAVHLACHSLWSGESTLALAGAANTILSPAASVSAAKARLLSSDGRCRVFDAKANGFARAEGAGVVVLKPLSRAVADGDPIHAVIRSTAIRQAGRTNGLMAPSRRAMEEVIHDACQRGGVSPGSISYVEASSGGSPIGDAAELNALGTVLATGRAPGTTCAVGSVKTNIGHLEAAAGMAGLIKTALMLRYRWQVPTLHFESPNPHVPFSTLPLRVLSDGEQWTTEDDTLLAGVSGSGFGGVYAHVILESMPARSPSVSPGNGRCLLVLSARNVTALRELTRQYTRMLDCPDVRLRDLCMTAAIGRSHFQHRIAAVASSVGELRGQLLASVEGKDVADLFSGVAPRRPTRGLTMSESMSLVDFASRYVQATQPPLESIFPPNAANRLHFMPSYPFQRRRHWVHARSCSAEVTPSKLVAPAPRSGNELGLSMRAQTIDQKLLQLFRQALGNEKLNVTDDFFAVGGGSLMAMDLIARIEKAFGTRLEPEILLKLATVQALAAVIQAGADPRTTPLSFTARAGGDEAPLFLVTPGHLFKFAALTRHLRRGHPLHVMAFGDRYSTPGQTIQDIADIYVAELLRACPSGPFHIFGFCIGGVVAYQMAQALSKLGRRPMSLGLLDAPCPPPGWRGSDWMRYGRLVYIASRCLVHARRALHMPPREVISYLHGRAKLVPAIVQRHDSRPDRHAMDAHREAIQRYVPISYDGLVDLYLGSEPWPSAAEDSRTRWRTLAPFGKISYFPGFHQGVLADPGVLDLADHLNQRLANEVRAEPEDASRTAP